MKTHGVYVSFSVLVESAALLLACLLVGLAAVHVSGLVLWLVVALGCSAAVAYSCWLWTLRDQHCYGLWQLQEVEE